VREESVVVVVRGQDGSSSSRSTGSVLVIQEIMQGMACFPVQY